MKCPEITILSSSIDKRSSRPSVLNKAKESTAAAVAAMDNFYEFGHKHELSVLKELHKSINAIE